MTQDENNTPEPTEWSDAALDAEPVLSHRTLHRIGWVAVAVFVVILLTVLPPLLNVNRYQRRVAQAISASIGRPVHFDAIHLHLLPLPGLTIQNFVVEEDPAFGFEPALRANTVEARLRLASLWRRRVEVSHIKLQAPSINLVRRSDGRWSLQGVVTQAGYLQNAPTAQGRASAAPRFPYIEATDARINVKAGNSKLPWSLLDAKLALWLPDENEWRVRLRGRPLRTDTDVSDVGELELEGSLGRGDGGVLNQPLAMSARWASTPLGEAAKLFVGRDTGFRGAASAELEIRGTPAHMQLSSDMHLHNLRRSEFVPRMPMSLDAHCQASAAGIIHALADVRCAIPTTSESAGLFQGVFRSRESTAPSAAPGILFLQAEIPDLLRPAASVASLDLKSASPEYFLNWLRVLSSRIPEAVSAAGKASLHAEWNTSSNPAAWSLGALCNCIVTPSMPGPTDGRNAPPSGSASGWLITLSHGSAGGASRPIADDSVNVSAARVQLANTSATTPPAGDAAPPQELPRADQIDSIVAVHGQLQRNGALMQYTSPDILRYVASLLPPLSDDLPSGMITGSAGRVVIQSERTWGGPQRWSVGPGAMPPPPRRKHR